MKSFIAVLAIAFLVGCTQPAPPPVVDTTPAVDEVKWEKSMVRLPVLGPKLGEDGKPLLDKEGKPTAVFSYAPTKVDMKTGEIRLLLPGDPLNAAHAVPAAAPAAPAAEAPKAEKK